MSTATIAQGGPFAAQIVRALRAYGLTSPGVFSGTTVTTTGAIQAGAAAAIGWTGRTQMTASADGNLLLRNAAGTDFGLLQFGGTTNSFPALKRSGTAILVRTADDGGAATLLSGVFSASVQYQVNSSALISATAPTVTSAGTSPSVTAGNGTATFRVNVGTGGTATTVVLALPAASAGWNCLWENLTANAANRIGQRMVPQSSTTTSATGQNQTIATGAALAFTASDIVQATCFAF